MGLSFWFQTIRPKTLPGSLFPTLAAVLYAHGLYAPFWFFNPSDILNSKYFISFAVIVCALSLQILSNLANDYFDFKKGADTKERKGPKRPLSLGLAEPKSFLKAIYMNIAFTLITGSYLVYIGGLPILLIGILSILFAILYTAGPYPLAYLGLGDIFAFIFFGPIPVLGTFFLLTSYWDFNLFLIGTLFGFLSMSLLSANNLRDYEEDAKSNKKTLIVRFGLNFGKYLYSFSILMSLALVPVFYYYKIIPLTSLAVLGLIPRAIRTLHFCWKREDPPGLLPLTAQFLIIYGFIICLSFLLGM